MKISVEPLDLLFFRNAKPFNSLDSPFGESLNFPYSSTFYGALRSKILSEKPSLYSDFKKGKADKLTEVIGTPQKKGKLNINFYSIIDENNRIYLPMAKDLVKEKDGSQYIFSLKLNKKPDWLSYDSSYKFDYILTATKNIKVESPENKFISLKNLKRYLNNDTHLHIKDKEFNFFTKENRTGIKINRNTNTVEKKMLYRKELLRLKEGHKFYIEISNDKNLLPYEGLLKLGGESKGAFYYIKNIDNSINLNKSTKLKIKESKKFKIYLATPAIFKKGWIPEWVNSSLIAKLGNGIQFKIIAAAVGKYKMISGWDIAQGKAKDGLRVVPGGSIYYCKILNDNFKVDNLIDKLHGIKISDIRKKDGFGISYLGGINNV